jgi:hypothetical protein
MPRSLGYYQSRVLLVGCVGSSTYGISNISAASLRVILGSKPPL